MPIATSQDFVKGIDFTGINPQTASQHNQLIDLAVPYGVSDTVGVGLVLTTVDTVLDTPDVPDASALYYTKWKRYTWNRIPFVDVAATNAVTVNGTNSITVASTTGIVVNSVISGNANIPAGTAVTAIVGLVLTISTNATGSATVSTTFTNYGVQRLYSWNNGGVSDATFLKWVLIDPASNTGIGTGLGTVLQSTLNALDTNVSTAVAAASSADTKVNDLQTACLGVVDPADITTDLNTQIQDVKADEIVDAADINLINNWAGGSDGLSGTAGVNGHLATIDAQITAVNTTVKSVSNLSTNNIVGSMLRVNTANITEWYDPTATATDLIRATNSATGSVIASGAIALTGTTSIPSGVYEVHASFSGILQHAGTSTNLGTYFTLAVNSITVATSTDCGAASGGNYPFCISFNGYVTITQASAPTPQTLTAALVTGSNSTVSHSIGAMQITFRKVALSI